MKAAHALRVNGWTLALALCALAGMPRTGWARCNGDCNGDRAVSVDEVIYCVNVVMGTQPLGGCITCDADGNGSVEINDLITSVTDVLEGCAPGGTPCPDYVPANCTELGSARPSIIKTCYKITKAGTYTFPTSVNILEDRTAKTKGGLYIVEDPGKGIDINVPSLLVEKGGTLQAGSACNPFGKQGGALRIGLFGDDPSAQATVKNPPPGIRCQTAPGSQVWPCFPSNQDWTGRYCTGSVDEPDSPCKSSTSKPATDPNNALLEPYGNLNFDNGSWGYKVLGVSYGGALNLFGYKGAKPLQGEDGAKIAAGEDNHCVVPTDKESTLDTAEMKAWATLSGSSWVRLQKINPERTILTLDRAVTDWKRGDQIVVGTTDWYPSHSEMRVIRDINTDGTEVTLCRPVNDPKGPGGCKETAVSQDALDYPHFAGIFDAKTLAGATYTQSKPNRAAADLRAAVGLLSRSIQIRSLGDTADRPFKDVKDCLFTGDTPPDPSCYFGGHMMVRQGFKEVQIQGVEFKQLGQGGRIGHYPVHFHLAKSTAYTKKKAFVKDSSIWDSMTRFAVLHGTHDVTLARNVGFLSMGNGYYLEDASEIDNRLCHNLGVSARGSLKEFFTAQADMTNWTGSPPAPSLEARYVPPILDGVCSGPEATDCNCLHPKSPPDPATTCLVADDVRLPQLRLGSDAFMPVMFWAMNAANEFVGNAAVGVHGFGSCYWLLSSGLSGPSFHHHKFDGLAAYNNVASGYQAPLRRFRGNSCTTSAVALSTQAEFPPASIGFKEDPYTAQGFTAVQNPYLLNPDGTPKPASKLDDLFDRPAVRGNFQPIQPNKAGPGGGFFSNCAQTVANSATAEKDGLQPNTKSCVTTLIDRFSTSFNWTEVNFSAVWLRPWSYLFLNSAITDQLFGGLTFVTGGSWVQLPPAYFSVAKNGLFVGTSRSEDKTADGYSKFALRSGPVFAVTKNSMLDAYEPCSRGPKSTCNLDLEGAGFWTGAFQPKRMLSIYDGPHFADGNLFVNVGAWECDPQPCQGKQPCELSLPCGIYSSTRQPAVKTGTTPDLHKMVVIDAAVGWKQPNGFYYPPAFAYRNSNFFKTVPDALKDLNMCYSFSDKDGFKDPHLLPGACRHNVVDRTRDYINGNMEHLIAGAQIAGPSDPLNPLPIGPIDFTTILTDLDASLTGASGAIPDDQSCTCGQACQTADGHKGTCKPIGTSQTCTCQVTLPTTSLSRNAFFNAPAQTDECLSFGLQSSPYQFVTTVMAELQSSPATTNPTYAVGTTDAANWPDRPGVAIYRQWKLAGETDNAGQVCDAGVSGSQRGMFMVGPNVFHAPALTQTEPPGLSSAQPVGLYYIDTSSGRPSTPQFTGSVTFTATTNTLAGTGIGTNLVRGQSILVEGAKHAENNSDFTVVTVSAGSITVDPGVVAEGPTANVKIRIALQATSCFKGTTPFATASFVKNKSYVLYHLFARNDAVVSYQLFVGDGVEGVDAIKGRFVRLNPHLFGPGGSFASLVTKPCKPGDMNDWCKGLPTPTVEKGILTVKLDQRSIAPDFAVENRVDYDRCMPRDLCYYDSASKKCQPCATASPEDKKNCIRQDDFLPADIKSLNQPDGTDKQPLDVICQDWSTLASGTAPRTVGDVSMIDCPKDGCLGFAFTLPDNFLGNKTYNDVGAKLTHCFNQSAWMGDALVARRDGDVLADPLCGAPRPVASTDFCMDPGPSGSPTATGTQTPTRMSGTPTNTATGHLTPTNTATPRPTATVTATTSVLPTSTATGTRTVTPTGAATPTPTATGAATPTPTTTTAPTPTRSGAPTNTQTPTVTPGQGSGFSWLLNNNKATTVNVPLGGKDFETLVLVDGQKRFCTDPGLHPILLVDLHLGASNPMVGVANTDTTDNQKVDHIPAGTQAGAYDLIVRTPLGCIGGISPKDLPFAGAITYTAP